MEIYYPASLKENESVRSEPVLSIYDQETEEDDSDIEMNEPEEEDYDMYESESEEDEKKGVMERSQLGRSGNPAREQCPSRMGTGRRKASGPQQPASFGTIKDGCS